MAERLILAPEWDWNLWGIAIYVHHRERTLVARYGGEVIATKTIGREGSIRIAPGTTGIDEDIEALFEEAEERTRRGLYLDSGVFSFGFDFEDDDF